MKNVPFVCVCVCVCVGAISCSPENGVRGGKRRRRRRRKEKGGGGVGGRVGGRGGKEEPRWEVPNFFLLFFHLGTFFPRNPDHLSINCIEDYPVPTKKNKRMATLGRFFTFRANQDVGILPFPHRAALLPVCFVGRIHFKLTASRIIRS